MPASAPVATGIPHGADHLPSVVVDSYNVELRDKEGFVGDRASNRAFRAILDDWRERLRQVGEDPLGETPSREISKKKLDKLLVEGDPEAAGVIQGAIEDFAQELATVIRRFLRLKGWRDTERIAVGGGLRESRIGELAVGRAAVLLKAAGVDIDLLPIGHHPDEAGLIGAAHLAPAWIFSGHDCLVGVDIGGTNIRAGIVLTNQKKTPDLSRAEVWKFDLWRHRDDDPPPSRADAVERLAAMVRDLVERAEKAEHKVAPFIGIGCPGLIGDDGAIQRGPEPARQLGEQPVQPAGGAAPGRAGDRRARDHGGHAQRRRRAGPLRGAGDAGRRALGRAHHRHRPRQRPLHQPRRAEGGEGLEPAVAVDPVRHRGGATAPPADRCIGPPC